MRADALGLWWEDRPVVRVLKAPPPKRIPPKPTWLADDYLPGLEEALAFPVHVMTDEELIAARYRGDRMVFDTECFRNYFLAAFMSLHTGHVAYYEMAPGYPLDINHVGWILQNFTVVGFNSHHYDLPILSMALAGKTCEQLKEATNKIILEELRPHDVLRSYKVKTLKGLDHIDLIEVAPLQASLKIYGGRLHAPRMQDLPFHPETNLSPQQMAITRWYCVNDLTQTAFLHEALKEQLALRESLGRDYDTDLRSKSDAQIAEAVISDEIWRLNGERPRPPKIDVGTVYRYQVPGFIRFQTPMMNWALGVVANTPLIVGEDGRVGLPEALQALELRIAGNVYAMGVGGLHSTEKRVAYHSDDNYVMLDRDVRSYYPEIILNLGMYPPHLGPNFLKVYKQIVDRRVAAKVRGDKTTADSLKITANGTFGKLGSKHSVLYAPDLLIQVTLTGQLALLMLIEMLELMGITVVSANTDGIVIRCPRKMLDICNWIIKEWEKMTGFTTEETRYKSYYAKDVNNYIAIKEEGGAKLKGAYANPWADPKLALFRMHKNPVNTICIEAVEALLTTNTAIDHTIRESRDIRKFVSVRRVKDGAVRNGEFLGSSIRWYYATGVEGEMVIASSGNKVPRSDGAKPLMVLPHQFPTDVDFDWYVREAFKILKQIAYSVD